MGSDDNKRTEGEGGKGGEGKDGRTFFFETGATGVTGLMPASGVYHQSTGPCVR